MQCYDVKTKRAGHLHTVTPTFPLPNAHFSRILTKGIPFNLEYIRLINISCQSSSNRRDPAHFPVLFQFLPHITRCVLNWSVKWVKYDHSHAYCPYIPCPWNTVIYYLNPIEQFSLLQKMAALKNYNISYIVLCQHERVSGPLVTLTSNNIISIMLFFRLRDFISNTPAGSVIF